MAHIPVEVHVVIEDTFAKTFSTKIAIALAIFMSQHALLLKYIEQTEDFFVYVTDTIPNSK